MDHFWFGLDAVAQICDLLAQSKLLLVAHRSFQTHEGWSTLWFGAPLRL